MGRWRHMHGKRLSTAIGIAALTVTVASCSGGGSSLSEEDFRSGVCRESAVHLLAVDDAVHQLESESKTPEEVTETLTQSQTELRALRDQADEALTEKISALTDAIGAFRIGIDTDTAGPEQTEQVDTALQNVLESCTTS